MTPERWREIKRRFDAALDIEPACRAAWLAEACAGDPELRREVEALLVSDLAAETGPLGKALPVTAAVPFAPASTGTPDGLELQAEHVPAELKIGADRYQVLGLLGAGGMGQVYLAWDRDLGRRVAIKAAHFGTPESAARLLQEAQVLARLEHPAIVPIHDVGLTAGGRLYYTMPVVGGRTLAEIIRQIVTGDPGTAAEWPLLAALSAAEASRKALTHARADAVRTLESALEIDPACAAARELLADHYWERLLEAEAAGRLDERDFLAERVAAYHDGKYARALDGTGSLELASEPPGVEAAERRAPRTSRDAPSRLVRRPDHRLELPARDAEGEEWSPRLPVFGISQEDARAYCAWRAARDGRPFRLPDELEWEKAARGVDGRAWPWGNRFDPSLANMAESLRGGTRPVPVDDFPDDVSIYGVRGMGGNMRDWTATREAAAAGGEATLAIGRGGAWNGERRHARCANRGPREATSVDDNWGFRVACSFADAPTARRTGA